MHVTLKSVFLVIFLTAAANVSLGQNLFVVQIEDDSGKPVRGAAVALNCGDGVVRDGVTDAKGEASVASWTAETCYLSVSARGFVPVASPLSLKEFPTGIVLRFQKAKPGSELKIELYDQNVKPVRGASVNISCGDGVIRRGVTDIKGMFEPPILPSSGRCSLTIGGGDIETVSWPLFSTSGHQAIEVTRRTATMKQKAEQKGTACPPERTLKDGSCGTTAQGKKTVGKGPAGSYSTLKVVDDKGEAVVPAEILIVCDGKKHSGYADRRGQFFFDAGDSSSCNVSVSHPDFYGYDGSIDTAQGLTHVVSLERTIAMGITVTVQDEAGKPVSGVDVSIEGLGGSWTRTSDGLGRATTNSLVTPGAYRAAAQHRDYYAASSSFEVPRSVGKTFATTLTIKRKEHVKTIKVTVTDNDTDKPIGEASVNLVGSWFTGYSGTTGSDGVASININRAGQFNVEVTRDNYFPAKTVFAIAPGAQGNDLEFFVSMNKKRVDGGTYPVKVKVIGEKSDGSSSPLSGAVVSPGDGDGMTTGADGWATVRFTGYSGDSSSIRVSRSGFEDKTVPFTVPRFSTSVTAPEITVTLKEKIAGLVLRVEVMDRDTQKVLTGATVNIGRLGTAMTNAEGIAEFSLSAEQLAGVDSITATASLDGYGIRDSLISGLRPRPVSDPRYHSIALSKRPTGLRASPYGPGGYWKLRNGYPMMGEPLKAVSGNPNNSASPGHFSFEHKGGIVTKFSFDVPPDVLPWGATLRLAMSGTSVTPADAVESTLGIIYIGPSPRKQSKLVGPFGPRNDGSWTTSDTLQFVFDPKEGTEFRIHFCVMYVSGTCFNYVYEPYPDGVPFASPR